MGKSIRALALEAISELDRRGWQTGGLGETGRYDGDGKYVDVPKEDCKVCLLGALSSAYNNFNPFYPGYNTGWNDVFHREAPGDLEYQKLLDAVIAELPDAVRSGQWDSTQIAAFNDQYANGAADVYVLLRRVADNNPDTAAVAAAE